MRERAEAGVINTPTYIQIFKMMTIITLDLDAHFIIN